MDVKGKGNFKPRCSEMLEIQPLWDVWRKKLFQFPQWARGVGMVLFWNNL